MSWRSMAAHRSTPSMSIASTFTVRLNLKAIASPSAITENIEKKMACRRE